ncbi:hypothetical protein YUMDRAFT_06558 [Streptomyces sp. OspMP-M45]|nr:hypothetical protein YUMDRAFT_06558 [Streptomyces sp. OspMP-M45]
MSCSCPPPPGAPPSPERVCRPVGAGEAAVVVSVVAAVTVLTVLQHPVPAVLFMLAAAAGALLMPGRIGCLLGSCTGGSR